MKLSHIRPSSLQTEIINVWAGGGSFVHAQPQCNETVHIIPHRNRTFPSEKCCLQIFILVWDILPLSSQSSHHNHHELSCSACYMHTNFWLENLKDTTRKT